MRKRKTHEQFLEDLKLKNEHYRNGYFHVVGHYINANTKILIQTNYGLCSSKPCDLLMGYRPTIEISLDPSEYFKNMCIEKFPEDFNNDLSHIKYVNRSTKIKVIDKDFGEYWVKPQHYLDGRRLYSRGVISRALKRKLDPSDIYTKIKKLHPELEFTIENYEGVNQYILVKNKYGICNVVINNLLRGYKPTIVSAINKTEYFINQAKEVHGDKYDYSLAEYTGVFEKVKIISKIYGIFEQSAGSHLQGYIPKIESRKHAQGWYYSNWQKTAEKSKKFTGFKMYIIECWDDENQEMFIKIGRTFTSIINRFKNKNAMPYSYKVLHVIESDNAREICKLEQEYKNKHKEYKYVPNKEFGGMYECFSKLIMVPI